jgi:hypothetical protein
MEHSWGLSSVEMIGHGQGGNNLKLSYPRKQHFLYFLPEPQGRGSLLPILTSVAPQKPSTAQPAATQKTKRP